MYNYDNNVWNMFRIFRIPWLFMGVVIFTLKDGRGRLKKPSVNKKNGIVVQEFILKMRCVEDVNTLLLMHI